jgi:hypothetical protein
LVSLFFLDRQEIVYSVPKGGLDFAGPYRTIIYILANWNVYIYIYTSSGGCCCLFATVLRDFCCFIRHIIINALSFVLSFSRTLFSLDQTHETFGGGGL